MSRIDCWVFTGCGREPGGSQVEELGVCPASIETRADGVNHGTNGGRACWAIAGTLCDGSVQGTYVAKIGTCFECAFYDAVQREEGVDLRSTTDILLRLVRMGSAPMAPQRGAAATE
jgi:hypothetical protein